MKHTLAFARFAKSAFSHATATINLAALKPWTWSEKKQNEADASAVRAIARASGFSWGASATAKKYSGLCIKSPGADVLKANKKLSDKYDAAREALRACRAQFVEQDEAAAMETYEARIVAMLAKLTPKRMDACVAKAKKVRASK